MNVYHRKLYALLHEPTKPARCSVMCQQLQCLKQNLKELDTWWYEEGKLGEQAADIGSSSDRVNLELKLLTVSNNVQVRHPISGESQEITEQEFDTAFEISQIATEPDVEKVFWWFWRFYPEAQASQQPNALLIPAHKILPDCPLHSYRSTVSALVGAMFPEQWQLEKPEHPYLLLFTFSPVQEFIKSSRKFLDFWAGSYLLHYLSVKLCWHIAETYGPDAVITPSLWSQEIIDALLVQKYPDFAAYFACLQDGVDPVGRFQKKKSTSLSTAGFPNVITALVPGEKAAKDLGDKLAQKLRCEWKQIAYKVRSDIKQQVKNFLKNPEKQEQQSAILAEFPDADRHACQRDLEKWLSGGCWEWNKLWDAQISNTWESYWTAVPLGNPDEKLVIDNKDSQGHYNQWKEAQEAIAPSRDEQPTPTKAEEIAYTTLNVGTWWGNVQSRLGQLIQSVKNTRTWQIPTAPGERSTLSGQFSAVHPQLHYEGRFTEGAGVSVGSMRLFWLVMAEAYPELFNGSEKLNALELTKRMAWVYGGVAESLGIKIAEGTSEELTHNLELNVEDAEALGTPAIIAPPEIYYERLIRFPNLSSIAAARFVHNHEQQVRQYWRVLAGLIKDHLPKYKPKFGSRTRGRPFQIPKIDAKINPKGQDGQDYNGVMFSSKWLAEDMDLHQEEVKILRSLVEQAHKESGFGDGSPADWWVIVLADGDGMGKYVSGAKLKKYKHYIVESQLASYPDRGWEELLETRKRMGPATHVGLNRALLDFSNRLVPYITEHRFCGKVVYSGGDDVLAVLPLEDLPEFLRSLRAAWCGGTDPQDEFEGRGGYWYPKEQIPGLPNRPHFTMGEGATMSMGIVIAYKSVPLPTVLEKLWDAEKERAKKLPGTKLDSDIEFKKLVLTYVLKILEEKQLALSFTILSLLNSYVSHIPAKDGLCFRVVYGSGNTLEALMKGHLLESWWKFIQQYQYDLSPVLYRLAEELPRHACLSESARMISKAALVILMRREQTLSPEIQQALLDWLDRWEYWAFHAQKAAGEKALGTQAEDLANLLRFSAFWVDKIVQRKEWVKSAHRRMANELV